MTFIHAADLHLDSPMLGLRHLPQTIFQRLKESTFISFSKIIDVAIQHGVDFVILAGDLFDGEDRSIRAQTRFRKQIERLAQYQIPVFIVHGNHDHLSGKWANIPLPPNAYVFPPELERQMVINEDKVSAALYGFSYPHRHVTERRIDDYKKQGEADFHIGILHGNLEGTSDHGNYAPFTLADLIEKQLDYWALGHIHKRTELSEEPPIIYPGNIQGRHRKETGEKGCYLVTMSDMDKNLEFIPTSDCVWQEIEVDGSSAQTIADLYQLCRKEIDAIRREGVGTLLTMKLVGVNLSAQENEHLSSGELLDSLQEEEEDEDLSFVWLVDLLIEEYQNYDRGQLVKNADFFEELFQAVDTYEHFDESLAPLYQHNTVRKYISRLQQDELDQLVSEAETLLVKLLKKE